MNDESSRDEWHFDFGLCATRAGQLIPDSHCEELLELIVRWAEEKSYGVGGGFREFTDEEKDPSSPF